MGRKENSCDCECIHKDKTNKAISQLNKIDNFNNITEFFKTFADDTRIKIIYILDKMGSMCVNDIAYVLDMTKSAISHQLKYLKDNRLVKVDKDGKSVFYSLSDKHVKDIFEIGLKHMEEL